VAEDQSDALILGEDRPYAAPRTGPPPTDPYASQRAVACVSLSIVHDYYGGPEGPGPCADLVLVPTPQTLPRLAKYGLLWRPRPDGGDILTTAGSEEDFRQAVNRLRGESTREIGQKLLREPLMFALFLRRPEFLNVTELPTGVGNGKVALRFSNRVEKPRHDGSSIVLTADAACMTVERAARHWQEDHEAETWRRDSATAHALGRPDPPALRERLAAGEDIFTLEQAAADWGSWHERRLPFAYLELHAYRPAGLPLENDTILFAVDLDRYFRGHGELKDLVGHVEYELRFAARRTRWRYIVTDRGSRFHDFRILDPDNVPVASSPPTVNLLPGGQASFALDVAEPIALSARPARRLRLEGAATVGGRWRRLVDPLPTPSADLIPQQAAGDQVRISEMFVFV
jgi:hypothetical protein